jgi:hypothetical protein
MKVYRYGLLDPIEGADRVRDQIRGAHRYYNTLIGIERRRRDAVAAAYSTHPRIGGLELERGQHEARLDGARKAKDVDAMRDAMAALRENRQALRAERLAAKQDPEIARMISEASAEAKGASRAARAASGVYWGTYLIVEQAVDAARKKPSMPHFRSWRGDGAVAVEIIHGMGVKDALKCDDARLRIDPCPQPVPGRGGKPLPRVSLRVGSDDQRAPIWATWPMIYHRLLPPDARIKWARVVREYTGGKARWSLHVTLDDAAVPRAEACGVGVVAVDLGWRRSPGGLLACEFGSETCQPEALILPHAIEGAMEKAESLRAIRDRNMNAARALIVAWRDAHEISGPLAERLRNVGQWRSQNRFASLAHLWRANRIEGDEEIYSAIEAWRKQDSHLWRWEAHTRQRAIRRRRDLYRVFAAGLARKYQTLVIERLNISALAQKPTKGPNDDTQGQRFIVAPSELRSALEHAFRARGGMIVSVPAGLGVIGMLAAYRERSGVEEKPAIARASKFKRIAAERVARTTVTA